MADEDTQEEQLREWPGGFTSVAARIAAARDLSLPLPDDAGPTDIIRRRLFAGERLNRDAVIQEFGVSTPFLAQVVSTLRKWGYVIENELVEHEDGHASTTYTLLNPEQEPYRLEKKPPRLTLEDKRRRDRERKRKQRANEPEAIEPVSTNGHNPPGLPTLPTLGDQVQVSFLAIGNDGDVRVGIRRGEQSWLLKLEGATE